MLFRWFDIIGLLLYRLILDFCYVYILSPIYDYTGFVNMATLSSYAISWIFFLTLLPLILSNYGKKTMSANVVVVLSCMSLIPMSTLIAFVPVTQTFILLNYFYWLLLLLLNILVYPLKFTQQRDGGGKYIFIFFAVILSLTVIYISWKYTHFRINTGLFNVYDLRFEAREYDIPTLLKYALSAANCILPIMLVYYMSEKKYIAVALLTFIIFLNFGIEGHKSVLFYLILCFLGYWLYKYERISLISWGLILVCFMTVMEFFVFNTSLTTALFTNRVLLLPSQLHTYYYDFFSNGEYDYFRQGILRWFGFNSSYNEGIAYMVSDEYFGFEGGMANNGLFSDAYSNLGPMGVLILPCILIIILRLLDACAYGLSEKLVILPILVTSIGLISANFSIVLLTNGLLLIMLILYFFPRSNEDVVNH